MNDEVQEEWRAAYKAYYVRLDWLRSVAGEAAVAKFTGAKVGALPYGSQYVSSVEGHLEGCRTLIELLDSLKDGLAIPSVDVDSYYARGKRWPTGMRLEGSRLIDTFPKGTAPRQETVARLDLESMNPEDFNFDFPGVEIPRRELSEEEAVDLANKLYLNLREQHQKIKSRPKPRE